MELQLGLSLSNSDLSDGFKSKEMIGLKPWRNDGCLFHNKKRSFQDAFEENANDELKQSTLPLLSWTDQPNDEDDDNHKEKKKLSCPLNNDEAVAEEDQVVGWPPIKSWRKKLVYPQQQGGGGRMIIKNRVAVTENNDTDGGGGESSYKYVKVKMEGVAIARKVDLRLFHCYQELTNFLIAMFAKSEDDHSSDFTLTYQDKDGDWLLAGDVPWQAFMESVQRLELVRHEG